MKIRFFFLVVVCVFQFGVAQDTNVWFYIRANDSAFEPEFKTLRNELIYDGKDQILKEIFKQHKVFTFKKTLKNAIKANLNKTFFVRCENESLLIDLINKAGHVFKSGELISEEDKKIYEPNDYGTTSTIGENIGLPLYLDYYDFLKVPKAWYYTTGERDIFIGISDGGIDTTEVEFKGKVKNFRKSAIAKGHGISIAAAAAAQGDNGTGTAGICYDCSLMGTTYDNPRTLEQLVELSRAGARVINCSWGSTTYYQGAQDAINEMYKNGTVLVSLQHNVSFQKTKGKKLYYPGSYDNVISISSGMHRYDKVTDNIKWDKGSATPYAENIKGFVGRTIGFTNNDTTSTYKIYEQSVRNINEKVDVLGPSVGLVHYSAYALRDKIEYSKDSPTSGVAPLISGTVGLMFSLYPCLPVYEVESIIKLTALNIDHIEANKPYAGLYGAGMLQTGDAVEMVYQLYSDKEMAIIEDQDFSRWDFKLTSLSEGVAMRNQIFRDDAKLQLKAKNSIVLGENTHLKPNANGSISLKIDPSLQKECDLRLRDPSIEK